MIQESKLSSDLKTPSIQNLTATLGDTELIITNVYIPPASSCTGGYLPFLDHLMMMTDTRILGDFNAHHSAWYSSSTDTRGTLLENVVSGSNFGILNLDSPTRLPCNANPSSVKITVYIDIQCFILDKSCRVCCLNYNTLDVSLSRTHRTFQCLASP